MAEISPRAIVEKGAELASDVKVGPFAYVGPNVRVGRGCVIENNATVTGRTTIGARTRIFPLAAVGVSPGAAGEQGECHIGEANAIRELVTVYASLDRPTRLGMDNLVMIASIIGPGAEVGDHGVFANSTHIGAGATVEDYVRTSAFPTIEAGVRVGAYTFINGYTGVCWDVPPFAMVEGCPPRIRGVNAENLRRCGFGDQDIRLLKEAFRDLYNGTRGRPDPEAVARFGADPRLNPHVRRLLDAIGRTPRAGGEDA